MHPPVESVLQLLNRFALLTILEVIDFLKTVTCLIMHNQGAKTAKKERGMLCALRATSICASQNQGTVSWTSTGNDS